jgi:hypothetical protein
MDMCDCVGNGRVQTINIREARDEQVERFQEGTRQDKDTRAQAHRHRLRTQQLLVQGACEVHISNEVQGAPCGRLNHTFDYVSKGTRCLCGISIKPPPDVTRSARA